jgi:hypothetical protein
MLFHGGGAPRRTPRTTDSVHPYPRFPNLVEGLVADHPDQVWVADITYVRLRKEFSTRSQAESDSRSGGIKVR